MATRRSLHESAPLAQSDEDSSPHSTQYRYRQPSSSGSDEEDLPSGPIGSSYDDNNDEINEIGNEDDGFPEDVLPSHLLRLVSGLETISLDDVREEAKEAGDGGDSDVEADGCYDHNEAMIMAQAERNKEEGNILVVDDNDRTSVVLSQGDIESMHGIKIPGAPDNCSGNSPFFA